MSRRGRKRKWRGQHLAGAPVMERAPDDRVRAGRQPHRRGLPEGDRLDERGESPLGQLALQGAIEEPQYEAGQRYAVIVGEYRTVIEAPRQMAGSGRGFECWADSVCNSDPDQCICRIRRTRYNSAYEALAQAGRCAAIMVARVCVHREEMCVGDMWALRRGLSSLAQHFGLTGNKGGRRILAITY